MPEGVTFFNSKWGRVWMTVLAVVLACVAVYAILFLYETFYFGKSATTGATHQESAPGVQLSEQQVQQVVDSTTAKPDSKPLSQQQKQQLIQSMSTQGAAYPQP